MKNNIIKVLPIGLVVALANMVSLQANTVEEATLDAPKAPEMRQHGMHGDHEGMMHEKQDGKMHQKMDPGRHLLRIADRLELSDDQEIEILKTSQHFKKQMQANRESSKEVRESLREMRQSKSFDEDAFRKSMEALQPTLIDGMVLHAKYKDALAEILTDEQKSKLDRLKKHLKKRAKNFNEKGKGRHGRENRHEHHDGHRPSWDR